MNFPAGFPKENILAWAARQIDAVAPTAPSGLDVDIRAAKRPRTYLQNKFLHAVIAHIADFVIKNGGWLDGIQLPAWAIGTETLKAYFKQKFGAESTSGLSTKELGELVDKIQAHMQTETRGEYAPLIPEEARWAEWMKQGEPL
jgi:hypothetical protein